MESERKLRLALNLIAIALLLVLAYQMLRFWDVKTWVVVDVVVVTYASGQLLEGPFVRWIESTNRKRPTPSGKPLFGRLWFFLAFTIGVLLAGLVGTFSADVLSTATANVRLAEVLTIESWAILAISFAIKFLPRRTRRKKGSYLQDMGADFGE